MRIDFATNETMSMFSLFIPFISMIIYGLIFRVISVNKKRATLITMLFIFLSCYLSYWFLSTYPYVTHSLMAHIAFALTLHAMLLIGTFPLFEYYYKLATSPDRVKFRASFSPQINNNNVEIYGNVIKVRIIGALGRYSLILTRLFLVFGLIYLVFAPKFGCPSLGVYSFLPAICSGIFFISTVSFLRMLVKCPNCNLDIYFMDTNKYAYNNVAKRVLKDNVMECWHCHAAYALDPNMDLEKLREENVKNWNDRSDIVKNLEEESKFGAKFM